MIFGEIHNCSPRDLSLKLYREENLFSYHGVDRPTIFLAFDLFLLNRQANGEDYITVSYMIFMGSRI